MRPRALITAGYFKTLSTSGTGVMFAMLNENCTDSVRTTILAHDECGDAANETVTMKKGNQVKAEHADRRVALNRDENCVCVGWRKSTQPHQDALGSTWIAELSKEFCKRASIVGVGQTNFDSACHCDCVT